MSDDKSRRMFVKWLGLGAGAAAIGGISAGCPGPGGSTTNDAAPTGADGDAGERTDGTSDAIETGPSDAETSEPADSRETDDATAEPDASEADGAETDTAGCEETGDDLEGPFHAEGAPHRNKLAPDDEPGNRIAIEGTVYAPDCRTPVQGALLDVWHANDGGEYYDASDNYRLRGQLKSDAKGRYEIRTIKPGRYRQAGGLRPAHVHFIVSTPQFGALTTQMYFAGDPYLGSDDSCGICASEDSTLIVDFQTRTRNGDPILVGTFDIVLSA